MKTIGRNLIYAIYFVSITLLLLFLGGMYISGVVDPFQPFFSFYATSIIVPSAVFLITCILISFSDRKIFFFNNALFFIIGGFSILGIEFSTRFLTPGWPDIGLHGIKPGIIAKAWGRTLGVNDIPFNTWGERDHIHTIRKTSNVYRAAFIGDSFLEESVSRPLSVMVDDLLSHDVIESINLGVSGTSPDEYYYRIKNIALQLDIDHIFLFIYTGNDFIQNRTLISNYGITAVYPRDSLFSFLGLRSINHFFTNQKRPIIRAWNRAASLAKSENAKWEKIVNAPDSKIPEILADMFFFKGKDKKKIVDYLSGRELTSFYRILRHPDKNLFRSYYLKYALYYIVTGKRPFVNDKYAYRWVYQSFQLAKKKSVHFTLVIIPEAFQVDKKMQKDWAPFMDMKHLSVRKRDAGNRLIKRARADGIRWIDLHQILGGKAGTYLDPDGHWSDNGNRIAAQAIATYLAENDLAKQ